jgi:hypothetical protein
MAAAEGQREEVVEQGFDKLYVALFFVLFFPRRAQDVEKAPTMWWPASGWATPRSTTQRMSRKQSKDAAAADDASGSAALAQKAATPATARE